MAIKVTVVVPVYNPGEYVEPCIDSLLAQTMPAAECELIFVDDGSTDGTGARLDELAAAHPHVRVIHRANSGWSGTPRNDGINAAVGEYIQFVDQDDLLGAQALDRLYARALATQADIVIGKSVGFGRRVAVNLWDRDRMQATLADDPLIYSLTPHKMFRRAFLDEHGLRFPDGKRRLEDHVFVTKAYFAAQRISVLSDYDCYFHTQREDLGNAGRESLDPEGYFTNLREALDVVEANTEPGAFRNRLLHRWLGSELLRRARGSMVLNWSDDYRARMLGAIRAVLLERFPPELDAGLDPGTALVAAMLRAGDVDALLAYARWERMLRLEPTLTALQWTGTGAQLTVRCRFVVGGGPGEPPARPLLARPADAGAPSGASYVELPTELTAGYLAPERLLLRSHLGKGFLTVRLRGAIDRANYGATTTVVPVPIGADGRWTPEVVLVLELDPGRRSSDTVFDPGLLDVSAEVRLGGWGRSRRVAVAAEPALPLAGLAGLAESTALAHWVWPYRTSDGKLSAAMQKRPPRVDGVPGRARLISSGAGLRRSVQVTLPTVGSLPATIGLTLRQGAHELDLGEAEVSDLGPGSIGKLVTASTSGLRPGRWTVKLALGGDAPELAVADKLLVVPARGARAMVRGAAGRLDRAARRGVRRAVGGRRR